MLVKFESNSPRVKGVSFHPKRPWLLASLHSGAIHLIDYRMDVLIDKFEEHEGPVRGINFHLSQPLFVSGGDDHLIKVWNYDQRRCLFPLKGHVDYIRTVQFHHEYPWIVSSSDDQTVRIWNWQSRTQLSVLTGHNHYVMCAQFHPTEDLILSASLDQTARVWDFSGLRKKTVTIASDIAQMQSGGGGPDIFGGTEVVVRHCLEGHVRGVNWASFHPTLSLIVTGADDREIKLWRMNDSKAWEVETMRGHGNNVSCVIFHPRRELIISNSEDKSIRIWDYSKQNGPQIFRRENDRHWILASHPTLNLMAAGHDSGTIVFKLNRERPPMVSTRKFLYYYKDLYIYEYNLKTGKEVPVVSTRRRSSNATTYHSLQYNTKNKSQHCFLLTSVSDQSYELYTVPIKEGSDEMSAPIRGAGKSVAFVARNSFAVLDKSRQICLKNLKNEIKRKLNIPNTYVSQIFPGGIGRILLRCTDSMKLYDVQSLKVLGSIIIQSRNPIKYVVWSDNGKYLAMFSKGQIWIANSKLEELTSVTETTRVKSGVWDEAGVFIYSTGTHIKYLLPNGDAGIIRTLDNPIYLTAVDKKIIQYIDRELGTLKMSIDNTEYLFKVALMKRRNRDVLQLMKSRKLVGQSIISYLQQKGYPEVALHFVEDPSSKFNLALECGNIQVALECATELNEIEAWEKLGVEALRQGNHEVMETAYQRTKNFERLSFLYLITGNLAKLEKMLHISNLRNDLLGRFHNALYLGNVQERVAVLRDAGKLELALLTARTHGLHEVANALEEELGEERAALVQANANAKLLVPPAPILQSANWPLLELRKTFFDQLDVTPLEDDDEPEEGTLEDDDEEEKAPSTQDLLSGWVGDDLPAGDEPAAEGAGWGGDGAWGDLDMPVDVDDLDDLANEEEEDVGDANEVYFPTPGKNPADAWGQSGLANDLIAAGQLDLAMHMLKRQIGVVNFAPLKSHMLAIANTSFIYTPMMGNASLSVPLTRNPAEEKAGKLPRLLFTLELVFDKVKRAYKSVTEGKFAGALEQFRAILHIIPFIVVADAAREHEVLEIVGICREYVTAMRLKLGWKDCKTAQRKAELAAYFTHTGIKSMHQALALKAAIKVCYDCKNFESAAGFCRRLLELGSNPAVAKMANMAQIRGLLKKCEKGSDAISLDYDESKSFNVCCQSLTPIYKKSDAVECPFCSSTYKSEYADKICSTCNISRIGAQASGLKTSANS